MEYLWWLIIIFTYLFILLIYVILSHLINKGEKKKMDGIDAIFFGVTSVITISLIPIIKSVTEVYDSD